MLITILTIVVVVVVVEGGVAMSRAQKTGPYSDDAKNLWPALIATDPATPSPRTEVAHMIHSPKYYPGNCSLSCFSSRNCPAVLTVGDMKVRLCVCVCVRARACACVRAHSSVSRPVALPCTSC